MEQINDYRIKIMAHSTVRVRYKLETDTQEGVRISFNKESLVKADRGYEKYSEIRADGIQGSQPIRKDNFFIEPDFNDYELFIKVEGAYGDPNPAPEVTQEYYQNQNAYAIKIRGAHANTEYLLIKIVIESPKLT